MSAHAPKVVLGYRRCRRCDDPWVPSHFAEQTGRLCETCFVANNRQPLRALEIVARSGVIAMPPKRRNRGPKKRVTPKDKRAEKAKLAAMRRLVAIFPDFFQMLLAEERADRGLSPRPRNAAPLGWDDPTGEQTRAFLEAYHRLDANGEQT